MFSDDVIHHPTVVSATDSWFDYHMGDPDDADAHCETYYSLKVKAERESVASAD